MAEILIVSRTVIGTRLCIGGIDIASHRSLRLLPAGLDSQPPDSPLQIGDVWDAEYTLRGTSPPFVEDANAVCQHLRGNINVAQYVATNMPVIDGSTDDIYDGLLHWSKGRKGFLEPSCPSGFSTQFWRPARALHRYPVEQRENAFIFWEPESRRKIPWVGAAEAPEVIAAGTLARLSLSRPFPGSQDHRVCWLQLSGVY